MQIQIHTRNLNVNTRLEDYVQKKINRLEKYLPHIAEIQLDLAQEHQRRGGERAIAQLTLRNERGTILRAEDKRQSDIFAAVDMVIDKMYRQISRYKGKRRRHAGDRFEALEPELAAAEALPDGIESETEEQELQEIVRRKEIDLAPMNEEEAIDQMELLGHDFFVFFNAESGKINVLYRREGGGYGLLQPNIA
jgi:putative sigma-54 modulation protein